VPRQKGMVLTDRDRALLGYLGVARYATAPQAHRLLAPGCDKAVTSRRLARMCEGGAGPDAEAFLRRLEYRRANSLPFPVWTLTPHGRDVAEASAPGPVAPFLAGAAIGFVLRVLAVNELLLALVVAGRRSAASPLVDLPFRWRGVSDPLKFEVRDLVRPARASVLRPAAIVDLPLERRRIFVEPELGVATLSPTDPRRKHVLRRLERYGSFFFGSPGHDVRRTWYTTSFPDGFAPEVLLLSTSEARRAQVEASVREHFRHKEPRFEARAFTLGSAIASLTPRVSVAAAAPTPRPSPTPAPAIAATPVRPPGRTVVIDDVLAERIRTGVNVFAETFNSMRSQVSAHAKTCPNHFNLSPPPTAELKAFRDLVRVVLLGQPPRIQGSQKP